MEKDQDDAGHLAFRVIGVVATLAVALILLSAAAGHALGLDQSEQPRNRDAALNFGPEPAAATPNPLVKISLPVESLDNTIPINTVFLTPIMTTRVDPVLSYVGFQGDFTFDQTVVTFQAPFVEPGGLTASGWFVSANVLDGPG